MSELSPETEELLERGRSGTELSRAHRDELKGAVLAKLATGAILTTSTSAAAWTVTTKVIGLAAIAAVVSVGTVGVVKYEARAHAPQVASAANDAPITATPIAPLADQQTDPASNTASAMNATTASEAPQTFPIVAPVQETTPSIPTMTTTTTTRENSTNLPAIVNAPTSTSSKNSGAGSTTTSFPSAPQASPIAAPTAAPAHASSLEEDATLLRAANDALAAGDPTRALRLLDEHAARFPNSALEPERSAERVFAFCAEQKIDDAHAAAGSFLSAHPSGPLASRVRTSCGGGGGL